MAPFWPRFDLWSRFRSLPPATKLTPKPPFPVPMATGGHPQIEGMRPTPVFPTLLQWAPRDAGGSCQQSNHGVHVRQSEVPPADLGQPHPAHAHPVELQRSLQLLATCGDDNSHIK